MYIRKYIPGGSAISEWFNENVVPYATAKRYMAFTSLVKNYPRILICNLSFSLIVKYLSLITNYLTTDYDLAAKLRLCLTVIAQGETIDIAPTDIPMVNIPKVRSNVDASFSEEATARHDSLQWDDETTDLIADFDLFDEDDLLEKNLKSLTL